MNFTECTQGIKVNMMMMNMCMSTMQMFICAGQFNTRVIPSYCS